METEELFLIFACLLLFFDLIQLFKAKPRGRKKLEFGFYASTLACGLIVAAYFILVQAFLADDFLLKEVYSLSSASMSTLNKIYASWAGMSGSMLFLTFLTALVYFAYRFKSYEKRSMFRITVYKLLDFILISFLLISLMNSPFQRLSGRPMDGAGLNPLLQTFWMFIHPPIVFFSYVLVILAFAFILANMSTGKNEHPRLINLCLQVAWLFSTLGIAIGGVWAYEVLGWGGYWAWDPVETASLLPWLALTTYFHLGPSARRGKTLFRELVILLAFSLIFFTTALTRGGLAVSVHAFGASPVGFALIFFIFCVMGYFFYLRRKIRKPVYIVDVNKSSILSISLFVGYWSLIILLIVSLWGVVFPIIGGALLKTPLSTGIDYFNNWSFPFVLCFVAALIGCNIPDKLTIRKYGMLIIGALGAGLVLVLVGQPTPNSMANLGLPLLILTLAFTVYNIARLLPKIRKSFPLVGRGFIHLGVVVILIGVFISSTTVEVSGAIQTKPNSSIESLGLLIKLQNFTVYPGVGNVHLGDRCYPEYSAVKMDVIIHDDLTSYERSLWLYLYTSSGVVSQPLIIHSWRGDLYLHMQHTTSIYSALVGALMGTITLPQDLIIDVRMIPFVYLVWIGVAFLALGMSMPLIHGIVRTTKQK